MPGGVFHERDCERRLRDKSLASFAVTLFINQIEWRNAHSESVMAESVGNKCAMSFSLAEQELIMQFDDYTRIMSETGNGAVASTKPEM